MWVLYTYHDELDETAGRSTYVAVGAAYTGIWYNDDANAPGIFSDDDVSDTASLDGIKGSPT